MSLGALECPEMLRPQRRSQGNQTRRKGMEVTARRWLSWDQPWSVGRGTARAAERAPPLTSAPNTWEKVKVDPTQPARLQTPPRVRLIASVTGSPGLAGTQCSLLIHPQGEQSRPVSKHSWVQGGSPGRTQRSKEVPTVAISTLWMEFQIGQVTFPKSHNH